MTTRPLFIPTKTAANLVDEPAIEFTWHPGFSAAQKKRNVAALHAAADDSEWSPILEVSTKSDEPLGVALSAFNLMIENDAGRMSVEAAYQGSKVFARGGPYRDIYKMDSLAAKKDSRLRNSGALTHFDYFGETWELHQNAFYDWLYISALAAQPDKLAQLDEYAGFTDIEFNPKRSFNCQARACAMAVSLRAIGGLDDALASQAAFVSAVSPSVLSMPQTFAAKARSVDASGE